MIIKTPSDMFTIVHQIKKEDFAPAIWAGTEGLTFVITHVDLDNGIITLEVKVK